MSLKSKWIVLKVQATNRWITFSDWIIYKFILPPPPKTVYLVVYDWVDGYSIYDAFTTSEAAGIYIEDVLHDTRRCQIREVKLWDGEFEHEVWKPGS
jgi:hypothetical protein